MQTTDGKIYGLELDLDSCNALMLGERGIRKDWLELEPRLMRSKWFDYRFLHPVQATYLYAHHFQIIYRRYFAQTIDRRAADHIRIFPDGDVFKAHKGTTSGIWRGRQIADTVGMPYEVFIDLAMEEALRGWGQSHLPRPQQLYMMRVIERVVERWDERQGGMLFYSELPHYANERYRGLGSQDDHHDWLMNQATRRGAEAPRILHSCVYRRAILPEDKVRVRFGDDMIERMRDAA